MPSRRKGESDADYKARNRKIYLARKQSGRTRGISLSQATGKAKRSNQRSIGDLHIDFRFPDIKKFFQGFRKAGRGATPLPVVGQPSAPVSGRPTTPPPGVTAVTIFITQNGARAIYPDGTVRRGSIDQIYDEAKATGLPVVVTSGNPPGVPYPRRRPQPRNTSQRKRKP